MGPLHKEDLKQTTIKQTNKQMNNKQNDKQIANKTKFTTGIYLLKFHHQTPKQSSKFSKWDKITENQ